MIQVPIQMEWESLEWNGIIYLKWNGRHLHVKIKILFNITLFLIYIFIKI